MFSRLALNTLRVGIRATGAVAGRRALTARNMSTYSYSKDSSSRIFRIGGLTLIAAGAIGVAAASNPVYASAPVADYKAIRGKIAKLIESDPSNGPLFIRLAWHASGTYDKNKKNGGSNGATMRFDPEAKWGANAGLHLARNLLEKIKKEHPEISYADLWTLAGVVAVEELGGPVVNWKPGRTDAPDSSKGPSDGVLPDADKGSKEKTIQHVRDIFYRMGFNDREIVALIGAHAVGRCHADRSGYIGAWTYDEFSFTNQFFVQLLERKWTTKKNPNGSVQFRDETGKIMMLPADLAFIQDPEFKKYVEMYAKDEKLFFADFAKAFQKLLELGVPFENAAGASSGGSWFSWLWGSK